MEEPTRFIGTGAGQVDEKPRHFLFEFNKAPQHPQLHVQVVSLAVSQQLVKDEEEDLEELLTLVKHMINNNLVNGWTTLDVFNILYNVTHVLNC